MAKRKAAARPTPKPAHTGPKRRPLAAARPAPAPKPAAVEEEPPRRRRVAPAAAAEAPKRRTAPPRERVTGTAARAARPTDVPRHSGDRRPTEAEIEAAQATLARAGRTVGPPRMKVQAKKMGFYDHKRRRRGDVFGLKDPKHFTRKWMVKVDQTTPERITTGREDLKRQHDEILGARMEGRSEATASMEVQEEEVDNPLED